MSRPYCLLLQHSLYDRKKIGKILAEDSIYVKHLGFGWNEWRYFWKLWNHPHEWAITDSTEYTASGPEPGVFKERNYLEGEIPSPVRLKEDWVLENNLAVL